MGTSQEQRPAPKRFFGRLDATTIATSVGLLVTAVVMLLALWVIPILPTHDGPQHVYLAHLLNHYSDPGAIYPEYYRPALPVSSWGFMALYAPLSSLFGWKVGLHVFITLVLILWSLGTGLVFWSAHPRRVALAPLGMVIAYQWSLYMGFFSFVSASALGLLIVALALRHKTWTGRFSALLGLLLFFEAIAHVFAAELTGLVVLAVALSRAPVRQWHRTLVRIALMGLPAMVIAVASASWLWHQKIPTPPVSFLEMSSIKDHLLLMRGTFIGGPNWHAWPLLVLALLSLVIGVRSWISRNLSATDKGLFVAGIALVVAFFFVPFSTKAWQFISPRLLPLGIVLLLALLPVERLARSPRLRWTVLISSVTFSVSALVWTLTFHKHIWHTFEPLFDGIDVPIPDGRVMFAARPKPARTLVRDWRTDPLPFWEPTFNVNKLYAAQHNGVALYAFTINPTIHPFILTQHGDDLFPPVPNRIVWEIQYIEACHAGNQATRKALLNQSAAYASRFPDTLFWGDRPDKELFLDRGYEQIWSDREAAILRYRGCPSKIHLTYPDTATGALQLSLRWGPLREPVFDIDVPEGATTVPLPHCPCGKVRLEIHEKSSSSTKRRLICAGAAPSGQLTLRATRLTGTLGGCRVTVLPTPPR